ncbi:hypothetical protein DLAC_02559 [Tieghemostelium lacteum]|uniref:Autophagy-related protein 29 n=1 Tax=Tieghemostelium lacteum TaxID=361077 RepID=A0A152A2U1_TIELA|nr:hypothetical protein DLAC_02559 [Tieghemostelium lacteum]|eukprot:KYR00546.1 hypothetical protein DLAC_02559 [Tieghemostelium lacteum]
MNIIVRLPYKRPTSVEENPIWTNEKDTILWKFISLHSQSNNNTDWNTISNRLNISESQCKLRASHLYKQQFLKLQNEAMTSLSITDGDNKVLTPPQQQQQQQQTKFYQPQSQTYSNLLDNDFKREQTKSSTTPQRPFQFKTYEEGQRFKEWVIKKNFDWLSISNELGLAASECRILYQSIENQQQLNNNFNISTNYVNSNKGGGILQSFPPRIDEDYKFSGNDDDDENPITQSELIEALIEEEEEDL